MAGGACSSVVRFRTKQKTPWIIYSHVIVYFLNKKGNVQVHPRHLSLGRDLIVPEVLSPEAIAPYVQLRQAMTPASDKHHTRPLAILQLNHTGRQSPLIIGGRGIFGGPPSAASSVPVRSRDKRDGVVSQLAYWLLFPTPKTLSTEDIDDVIERFVRGAQLAHQAGFDGIELHASHGCELKEDLFVDLLCSLNFLPIKTLFPVSSRQRSVRSASKLFSSCAHDEVYS